MGRSIMRVPLDFNFPLDESFADAAWEQHQRTCRIPDCENACADEFDWESFVPKGEGWQLWQTISDGPITPVFRTAEELIDYMSQPVPLAEQGHGMFSGPYPPMPGAKGWRREVAEHFVLEVRDAPTMVFDGKNRTFASGAEAAYLEKKK